MQNDQLSRKSEKIRHFRKVWKDQGRKQPWKNQGRSQITLFLLSFLNENLGNFFRLCIEGERENVGCGKSGENQEIFMQNPLVTVV